MFILPNNSHYIGGPEEQLLPSLGSLKTDHFTRAKQTNVPLYICSEQPNVVWEWNVGMWEDGLICMVVVVNW